MQCLSLQYKLWPVLVAAALQVTAGSSAQLQQQQQQQGQVAAAPSGSETDQANPRPRRLEEQQGTCCVYCTKSFGDDAELESEPYKCLDDKTESTECQREKFSVLPRCPYRVHWEPQKAGGIPLVQKAGGIPLWTTAIILAVILVSALALLTLRSKAE
mmetsp:Transcript_39260/g.77723  ORF Transcript_39260/g.77723 Transcript_39260/m.77723 type:complete len:158 (+) Transcript_39260:74-547(+)